MTSYFDQTHERLRKCKDELVAAIAADDGMRLNAAFSEMEQIEKKLLFDVQLCASLPHFPADLADDIQVVIARHSLEPLYNVNRDLPDEDEQFASLNKLTFDLHTIFHSVGSLQIPGLSDKPDSILRTQAESRYERRVELMRDPKYQEKFPDFIELLRRYDRQNAAVAAELVEP